MGSLNCLIQSGFALKILRTKKDNLNTHKFQNDVGYSKLSPHILN